MSNIVKRTLSGAVFVVCIIGSLLLHPYVYAGIFTIIIAWSLLEFYDILIKDRVRPGKFIGLLSGIVFFAASFFYAQNLVSGDVFFVFIPLFVILFISQLYYYDHNSFRAGAYTLTGIIYIALPFALCNGLVFREQNGQIEYVPDILLGVFILLWTNDTFAYLTGMIFGKNRLFERLSPKKSWEGFFGGLICTIAVSLLLIPKLFPGSLPYKHWAAIAAIIVVFGVYGDLFESMLKRNLRIKDSGHFLPGHGGILDRFDSVLLAAPMVFFYLKLFVF